MTNSDEKPTVNVNMETTVYTDATVFKVVISGADADARALVEQGVTLAVKSLLDT